MSKVKTVIEHDGSEWVDAEIAQEMYAALESLIGAYESLYFEVYGDPIDESEMEEERKLLAKARGETK